MQKVLIPNNDSVQKRQNSRSKFSMVLPLFSISILSIPLLSGNGIDVSNNIDVTGYNQEFNKFKSGSLQDEIFFVTKLSYNFDKMIEDPMYKKIIDGDDTFQDLSIIILLSGLSDLTITADLGHLIEIHGDVTSGMVNIHETKFNDLMNDMLDNLETYVDTETDYNEFQPLIIYYGFEGYVEDDINSGLPLEMSIEKEKRVEIIFNFYDDLFNEINLINDVIETSPNIKSLTLDVENRVNNVITNYNYLVGLLNDNYSIIKNSDYYLSIESFKGCRIELALIDLESNLLRFNHEPQFNVKQLIEPVGNDPLSSIYDKMVLMFTK